MIKSHTLNLHLSQKKTEKPIPYILIHSLRQLFVSLQHDRRTKQSLTRFRWPQSTTSPNSRATRKHKHQQRLFHHQIHFHTKKLVHNFGTVVVPFHMPVREAGCSTNESENARCDCLGFRLVGHASCASSCYFHVSLVSIPHLWDCFCWYRGALLHGRCYHACSWKLHSRSRRWTLQRSPEIGLECESPYLTLFIFVYSR